MLAIQALDRCVFVDVDSLDPAVAKRAAAGLGHLPQDQTSNPIWVMLAMQDEKHKSDLEDSIRARYNEGGWEAVHDHFVAKLCARNKPNFAGRVLVQLSGRHVHNKEGTLQQTRRIAREFDLLGLSKNDFALKIPVTGPNANACKELVAEGYKILGTLVLCVTQAIAASQAGCWYISPYYNESAAHVDPAKYWPNKEDPALEHPMSPRVLQIIEIYKELYKRTGKRQPLMKLAGFVSYKESLGAAELGASSCTHVAKTIDELCSIEVPEPIRGNPRQSETDYYPKSSEIAARLRDWAKSDPLANADWNGSMPSADTDYLANNGALIDQAIENDATAKARFAFSTNRHVACDNTCQDVIETLVRNQPELVTSS